MKTIEMSVTVAEDRRVVLHLPPEVPPGEHRIVVHVEEEPAAPGLQWEGNLLVHQGTSPPEAEATLREVREERLRRLGAGPSS